MGETRKAPWEGAQEANLSTPSDEIRAPDPFSPELFRLDLSRELIGIKKVIGTVTVRKPGPKEFVRVRPEPEFRLPAGIIEVKEDRETFLVHPAMREELAGEMKPFMLFTAINRAGALFIWPVPLPGPGGRRNPWHESHMKGAEVGMVRWVRIEANMAAGMYDVMVAQGALPDPEWPDLDFGAILKLAFGFNVIDSADHPVVRRLRGLA